MTLKQFKKKLDELEVSAKALLKAAPTVGAQDDADRIVFSIGYARRMLAHDMVGKMKMNAGKRGA